MKGFPFLSGVDVAKSALEEPEGLFLLFVRFERPQQQFRFVITMNTSANVCHLELAREVDAMDATPDHETVLSAVIVIQVFGTSTPQVVPSKTKIT